MDPHAGFANTAVISVLTLNLGKPLNYQLKRQFRHHRSVHLNFQ